MQGFGYRELLQALVSSLLRECNPGPEQTNRALDSAHSIVLGLIKTDGDLGKHQAEWKPVFEDWCNRLEDQEYSELAERARSTCQSLQRSEMVQLPDAGPKATGSQGYPARFSEQDALLQFLVSLRGTAASIRRRALSYQGCYGRAGPGIEDLEALWEQAPGPDGLTTAAGPTAVLLPQETWLPYTAFESSEAVEGLDTALSRRPRWDPLAAEDQRRVQQLRLEGRGHSVSATHHPSLFSLSTTTQAWTPRRGELVGIQKVPTQKTPERQNTSLPQHSSLPLALNLLAMDSTPGKYTVFGKQLNSSSNKTPQPRVATEQLGALTGRLLSPAGILGAQPESDSDDAASVGPLTSREPLPFDSPRWSRIVRDHERRSPVVIWDRVPRRELWSPGETHASAMALAAVMGNLAALTTLQITLAGEGSQGTEGGPSGGPDAARRPAAVAVLRRLESVARDRAVIQSRLDELGGKGPTQRALAAALAREIRVTDARLLRLVRDWGAPTVLHLEGRALLEKETREGSGRRREPRNRTRTTISGFCTRPSQSSREVGPGTVLLDRRGLSLLQVDIGCRNCVRLLRTLRTLLDTKLASAFDDENRLLELLHAEARAGQNATFDSFKPSNDDYVNPRCQMLWRLLLGALGPWAERALATAGILEASSDAQNDASSPPPVPPSFLQRLSRPLRVLSMQRKLLVDAGKSHGRRASIGNDSKHNNSDASLYPDGFMDLLHGGGTIENLQSIHASESPLSSQKPGSVGRQPPPACWLELGAPAVTSGPSNAHDKCLETNHGARIGSEITDLDRWLIGPILKEYSLVSNAALSFLILEDGQLLSTLGAVQSYIFMGDGDWAAGLAAALSSALDGLEPLSMQVLDRILDQALQQSPRWSNLATSQTGVRLRLEGARDNELAALPLAPDSLEALSTLRLDLDAAKHVSCVVTPAALEPLSAAFTSHLQVHRTLALVNRDLQALPSMRGPRRGQTESEPGMNLLKVRVALWKARQACLALLELQHRQACFSGAWESFMVRLQVTEAALRGDMQNSATRRPITNANTNTISKRRLHKPFEDVEDLCNACSAAAGAVRQGCMAVGRVQDAVLGAAFGLATRLRRVIVSAEVQGWDGSTQTVAIFDSTLAKAWSEVRICITDLDTAIGQTVDVCGKSAGPQFQAVGLLSCQLSVRGHVEDW